MKNYIGIIALFFVAAQSLFSQTTKLYTTENGLSNSLINQVYQDRKGFVWIATESGLNKFDGNKFVIYRKQPGDSTSLKNNHSRTLFEDSQGNFWMATIDGLMTYNRTADAFHEVVVRDDAGKRLYPNVKSIIELSNGDLWFASSGDGLLAVKKGSTTCEPLKQLNERLCSRFLTVLYEDSNHKIWIGSENSGLNVYSLDSNKLLTFTATAPVAYRINSNAITAICEGDKGAVFVGMLNGGVDRFDLSNMHITFIPDKSGNRQLPIKTIIYNRQKQLLVGTDGFGMKLYNPSTRMLDDYAPVATTFDLSKAKVHSLWEDKDGNIWVGLFQKGVFFIPGNLNGFKYYGYKSFSKNSIGSNCVMTILKDNDDIIWVGTDNDGLYAITEQTQQVRHFSHSDDPQSVPNTIICIQEAGTKLWLGSYLNGVTLFDKQTGKCQLTILPNEKIYCMAEDRKGNLWLGTHGGGLYKLNLATQTIIEHYYQEHEGDVGLSNNWINSLQQEDGLLWIGTFKGLNCLNTATKTFRTYKQDNSRLPSNIILTTKKDRAGNIYIGTDGGLAYLNRRTEQINVYTTEQGLSDNMIRAIEDDAEGNIWLSTLSGISKLSPKTKVFTNYYASDGLQGNEFSRGAAFKSADGELFFGGVNGITSFYPTDIRPNVRKLNVYPTDFYLFGKQAILPQPLMETQRITLAADNNVFSVEFSTLEYDNPEGISYRYRLENFDVAWLTTAPGNNRINYTNLLPGKYKLLFQATDKENQSEIKSIEIIIAPPWYLSWWAKCIYLLLFGLLAWGVSWFIADKVHHKNELLRLEHTEQINEAKLQFFINISHEIRTPMTLIMGPMEKLMKNNKDPEIHNTYVLIYRNAQRILRLINQLMDVRKIDKGQMQLKFRETDMVGFIQDIMQVFDYTAKKKNLDFEFVHDQPLLKVWVDLNNFDKVLFNVFSNAFKYTPEQGKITVELLTEQETFTIKISDTGIGIDLDKIDRIFERFYQIDSEITNSNFGTGVGLHLTRSLVGLMQGTIHAERRGEEPGSTFIIRMPLGNAHLRPDEMEIITNPQAPLATFAYSKKDDLFEEEMDLNVLPEKVKATTKSRVLVVEDESEISDYIKRELAATYRVSQVANGKEALAFILKEKPDLVVSDVMMPVMDGITLCRKIKSNINIEHIPVVLLTAKSNEEDLSEGLSIGADAYITKPFNPEILKKTIANLLSNRERLKGKHQTQTEGKIKQIEIAAYDDVLMERILKAVNAHIADPKLNVEHLASEVGMSRVHLHRKLKELVNQSAGDFIRTIRLKQAGELLKTKKYTISQVATDVGFASLSHFSSRFKDFYGVSPTEFMDSH
ncbi:MAG: response regulator [Candidatus Symbiothrix sp.]|jgi:signal transduction histidine kinase/ligand-binding sensor domain-containing protein/AraC-like DNA-binding protein|nr:response regulator [Candidatus Symbiothrix sp.]